MNWSSIIPVLTPDGLTTIVVRLPDQNLFSEPITEQFQLSVDMFAYGRKKCF